MLNIKIKEKTKVQPANDFGVNEMFTDEDGDLYLRCFDGIVGINEPDELTPYTDKELTDYESFPYLKECSPFAGILKVKVKVKT
jgi:hypothetical protein